MSEAVKLLDDVFKVMQPKSDKPTLSETNQCYLNAVSVIEKALQNQYQKGRNGALQEIKEKESQKKQQQN